MARKKKVEEQKVEDNVVENESVRVADGSDQERDFDPSVKVTKVTSEPEKEEEE